MKTNVYLGIAIRIIILFGVGMMWTFVPEHLVEFFGDRPCERTWGCGLNSGEVEWGARHYWYWWMMFLLFILSLINVIIQIINIIKKHYGEDII